MPTLNQWASQLANTIGKPTDDELLYRLEDIIKQGRALLVRRSVERNGIDKHFVQRYITTLTKVDKADSCVVEIGCNILRTTNKIPMPIRLKGISPFLFVGSPDGLVIFPHINIYEMSYRQKLKYTSNIIGYDYIDQYLYVYGNIKLDTIRADAAYESPDLILQTADNCSSTGICYTNDMEFPLSMDMFQEIKLMLLSGELKLELSRGYDKQDEDETNDIKIDNE